MFEKTHISISVLRTASLAAAAMLAAITASAQSTPTYSQYAAKFLCGVPAATQVSQGQVENAEYSTSINIHNPNMFSTEAPISFVKKAVITHPEGSTLTPPSSFRQDSLPNDYAESVTCSVIRGLLGAAAPAAPAFIEGFVVIIVPPVVNSAGAIIPNELDVTAVYSSSNNPPTSLEVVPIPVRLVAPPPTVAAIAGTFQ